MCKHKLGTRSSEANISVKRLKLFICKCVVCAKHTKMLHESLLTKYIHIAGVVALYWYVYKLSFKCTECGAVRSGTLTSRVHISTQMLPIHELSAVKNSYLETFFM
jgi:uncharacterized Zn finger protein